MLSNNLIVFLGQVLAQQPPREGVALITAPVADLGFTVPSFSQVITFLIRLFFVVAGLIALINLLLGAFGWITSGGNKESIEKAREKIQAAIIGLILIFVVLSIVVVLENILNIGLGITKPIQFPQLIQPTQPSR
ncbi:MAG: hypothetical protein NZL96_03660 [Patescibacteria group bacterium]|nr:hypothetical protein [Patescibacteria group bacterium]